MRRHLVAAGVVIAGLGAAEPSGAQAKGSAEASAAAVVNPKWKAPKLAWGHPDLEGIWTSDDMRGVPMSRPPQTAPAAFSPTRSSPRAPASARPREKSTTRGPAPSATRKARATSAIPRW